MMQTFINLRRLITIESNLAEASRRHSRISPNGSDRSQRSASNPSASETYSNARPRPSSSWKQQQHSDPPQMTMFKSIRYAATAGQVLRPGGSNTSSATGAQSDSTCYPLPSVPFTAPRAAPPVPMPTIKTTPPSRARSRTRLQKKARKPSSKRGGRPSSSNSGQGEFDGSREHGAPSLASGKPEGGGMMMKETPETESDTYRDFSFAVPPRVTVDGLNTPRRSEWSEDSDEEPWSLRQAARDLPTSGRRKTRPMKKLWYGVGIGIGVLVAAAIVVGVVLGIKKDQSKETLAKDLGKKTEEDRDGTAYSADTSSNIGFANWRWDNGDMSLFTADGGYVKMLTRPAGRAAWTTSNALIADVIDSSLRLAVSRKEGQTSRWALFYVNKTDNVLSSATLDLPDSTQGAEREALGESGKWTLGSLGNLAIVVPYANTTHFQSCGNENKALNMTDTAGPGDMAALFWQEPGQLRMVKYQRDSDTWTFDDLPPEMAATPIGLATCVYEDEYLNVWLWGANSTLQQYMRPLNASWAQGWTAGFLIHDEQLTPGGDFDAVHSGNYTTLMYQDSDLNVRQLTVTRKGLSTQAAATIVLGSANNGTAIAGARSHDGLRIFWQKGANVTEKDLRVEVNTSGEVAMVGDSYNGDTSPATKGALCIPQMALVAALSYLFLAI